MKDAPHFPIIMQRSMIFNFQPDDDVVCAGRFDSGNQETYVEREASSCSSDNRKHNQDVYRVRLKEQRLSIRNATRTLYQALAN